MMVTSSSRSGRSAVRTSRFEQRGRPADIGKLQWNAVVKIMVFYSDAFLPASPEATWQRHEPTSSTGLTSAALGVGPAGRRQSTTAWSPGKWSPWVTEPAGLKSHKRLQNLQQLAAPHEWQMITTGYYASAGRVGGGIDPEPAAGSTLAPCCNCVSYQRL